jgi:hypothetical protein
MTLALAHRGKLHRDTTWVDNERSARLARRSKPNQESRGAHEEFLTHLLRETFLRPVLRGDFESEVRSCKRLAVFELLASPRPLREISAENMVLE